MPVDLSELDKLTEKTAHMIGGLNITKVTETKQFFNILFYGNPGVGKTVLAGSASLVPELCPVLFVDVEGGTLSLRKTYPNVDVVRVQTWDDVQRIYNDLYDGKTPYKTVVLDSLSEIQKFSMAQIMKDIVEENEDRDPDVAGMREWGKNIEQIRRLVRGFRDLPINTIFTALAMQDKDNRGLMLTKPSLQGKVGNEVPGLLDIVLYYYIKRVDNRDVRLLLTSGTDSQIAKDRSGLLPQIVEEPTMVTIYNLLTGVTTNEG